MLCTCSELLERTACGEPYTSDVTMYSNEEDCNFEMLVYDIREVAAGSESMASNCEYVLSFFHTYGSFPQAEVCDCFGPIPEESASIILNCYLSGFRLLNLWGICVGKPSFTLLQRTITTDPDEICPASCGLCGTPAPVHEPTPEPSWEYLGIPTVEPTECTDIAQHSDVCRYSSMLCTCSELLERTACGEPYTSDVTMYSNEEDCNFEMLVYDIREVAAGSESMASNCEYVLSFFHTYGSFPQAEVCDCFGPIPEESASIILNCYLSGFRLLNLWSICVGKPSFTLIQRTITTDPDEICPASCGLCGTPPVHEPTPEPSECEPVLLFGEVSDQLCLDGYTGDEYGDPVVCSYWERLDSGLYQLTSTIYQDSFENSLANRLFKTCWGTCVYDLYTMANVAYEWLSWKGCWKKVTQGICFEEYAEEQAEAEDKINDLCTWTTPSPEVACTERVQVWNETIAWQTCNLDHGATDKSASASVCDGYEDQQHILEHSLANRMFLSCKAWCVYNIYARAYEAFIWRAAGCWEPSDTCIDSFVEEREAMTDYVDNVLCASETPEPTVEPTCIPEFEYSEELMDEHCTVSATKTTFKHYETINREPVACSGLSQDTLNLKKSLANELYDNCGAWCVFDWSTQALEAWVWTSSELCWSRKSDGWCLFDNANTRTQIWTEARMILASSCNANAATFCNNEFEWTQERADDLCASTNYGATDKSYSGANVCADESGRQAQLEKSLANKLYDSCSSWCVYDWDTLMDNIDEMGGYKWNNGDNCYMWVTAGACFNAHAAEYQASREYVLETCLYLNL